MSCLGDCWDLGPPPDNILFLPPPPLPSFLQPSLPDVAANATFCSSFQLCESLIISNKMPDGGDYIELPRKDIDNWTVSSIDDTWLLVLVASSIGVLLLGALLAMFLLKCREMTMFGSGECSMHSRDHRQMKNPETRESNSVNNLNGNKLIHPSEAVLYHGNVTSSQLHADNRMVWAALTPRGTQHFVSENYPRDLGDYVNAEDHYETINSHSAHPIREVAPKTYTSYMTCSKGLGRRKGSFDNSGFMDYDYEDPTPLIESYQPDGVNENESRYTTLGNTDMRCSSLAFNDSLRRGMPLGIALRPKVSPPTRIENPNLPPLNLYPHNGNTLKRNTFSYRATEANSLPKYSC